jgi:hypothetical protein
MKKGVLLLFIVLLGLAGCQEKALKRQTVTAGKALEERAVEILETTAVQEMITGWDREKNEVYIEAIPDDKEKHIIQVIDIDNGKLKNTLEIRRGSFASPTDFYNPTYMEYLDGKYYVVDQSEKVAVFGPGLDHIFSSMHSQLRYFIDFFQCEDKTFFVIASKLPFLKAQGSEIELYGISKHRKPELVETLFKTEFKTIRQLAGNKKKFYYKGMIWPSMCGFEKQGKIFYSAMTENCYYVYDLKTKKTNSVQLTYLKPKTFSDEDAARFGFYKTDGWEERFSRMRKKKVVYRAYPGVIYHFGLYDVGENKIGIVGDLDLDQMKFRLDIIDCNSHKYQESIRLPIGIGFSIILSGSHRGFIQNYIDVDRGIYIWQDIEGENSEYFVKLTKFKIKAAPGQGGK